MDLLKSFIKEEDGLGTVEIAIIVAVLVGVALIFRKALVNMVDQVLASSFENGGDAVNGVEDTNNLGSMEFGATEAN